MESVEICGQLTRAREHVAELCHAAGRDPSAVDIMLAVKTQSAQAIREAIACGGRLLGHNRVQELVATGKDLRAAGLDVELHLIGPLQRNKVNHALRYATGIQTLDSAELADRVSECLQRLGAESEIARRGRTALDVMIQVNVSGEETKSGCRPNETLELAAHVAKRKNLRLTGLMTIGPLTEDADAIREAYAQLRELAEDIASSGIAGTENCRELSMGMTNDLAEAIEQGATMVRLGRAVFGQRAG